MKAADFVVVGGGSAGCVLAARLSEGGQHHVVLVEAGPDYADEAALPADIRDGHWPAFSHDWGYKSEPGISGLPLDLTRAKLIGGCSATNATFALRGSPADYDEWAALGNPEWSFRAVLPYFRRLERDNDFDDEWHGREGPIPIRRYTRPELTPVHLAFAEAAAAAGHARVADHNAPGSTGVGPTPVNTLKGVRQSTALCYLGPARSRPNLAIRSDALADRVLLTAGRVSGLALASGEVIPASRVVLASGSYGSPAILLRSGVGPKAHLARLGIACASDLDGVGRNLSDHPLMGVGFAMPSPISVDRPGYQVVLTLRSSLADDPGPDLHIFPSFSAPDDSGKNLFTLYVGVMKPRARGRLTLDSTDPATPPRIHTAMLEDDRDFARIIEGVGEARRIARTAPLSGLALEELMPGPGTAADLDAAVRAQSGTYFHPVGTCRMGPAGDRGAVVDSAGRVHGTDGLHVADASIMPTIPRANTNLTALMIAERIAELLLTETRAIATRQFSE